MINAYIRELLSRLSLPAENNVLQITHTSEEPNKITGAIQQSDTDVSTMHQMTFPANAFDAIVIYQALEYTLLENKSLGEIYRVLKPDGKGVIVVSNRNFPLLYDPVGWFTQNILRAPLRSSRAWKGKHRLYHVDDIRKKLEAHRLRVTEIQAISSSGKVRELSEPSELIVALVQKN